MCYDDSQSKLAPGYAIFYPLCVWYGENTRKLENDISCHFIRLYLIKHEIQESIGDSRIFLKLKMCIMHQNIL